MKFTIEKVSKMTGLPATTLRNWEKRYGFPRPVRSASGHRAYVSKDLEFLRKVKDWIASGHTLSQIASFYQTEVVEASEKNQPKTPEKRPSKQYWEFETDVEFRVNLLFDSLLEYDMFTSVAHYTMLNTKLSPEDLVSEVFEPLLLRSAEAHRLEEITAAQLHFIVGFVRQRLMSFLSMGMTPSQDKRFVMAMISEDADELGSLLIAAMMKFRGYSVFLMGPQLSLNEMTSALQELKADCIAFFYTDSERLQTDLPILNELESSVCLVQFSLLKRIQKNYCFCIYSKFFYSYT